MDKAALRDILFQKYFQIEDGVLVRDLVEKLSFIPELWEKLHSLCEENIQYFDSFSSLEKCKMIEYNQKKYLILKLRMYKYVIIDAEKMENITDLEFKNEFDENFFVNNFDEIKGEDASFFSGLCRIENYDGDIQELINFCIENQNILCLSSKLRYKLEEGNAWTYFFIDFVNANAQMGFQTPDQFLYEQLFLRYDLTASGMQDAQERIGIEKMQEMFEKIKEIRIPNECIPNDLYHQYLIQCSTDINKQIVKKL